MMKSIVAATFVGLASAKCDGGPCQLLAQHQVSRLAEDDDESAMPSFNPSVTTFTAVDTCATQEISMLTTWVLKYYESVANQLDVSFSNIMMCARLANSALRYLGALSGELQAFQRINQIGTEMNSMLRVCTADALHLSASFEKCDMSYAPDAGADGFMTSGDSISDKAFVEPLTVNANGTCLGATCEHYAAYNGTCGSMGFLKDLEHVAASHDMDGSNSNGMAFRSAREAPYHQPVSNLWDESVDAGTFAILMEDSFVQAHSLLNRVNLWLEVQFQGMMVMVRKQMNGGKMAEWEDAEICSVLGWPMETVSWLSVMFQKCHGSMVHKWLKVTPMNREFMHKLVANLADKIDNVVKEGDTHNTVFGGMLINMCARLDDLQPEIEAAVQELQSEYEAMHDGANGGKKIDTFYLNGVVPKGNDGSDMQAFDKGTGNTQQWYMKDVGSFGSQ